MDKSYQICIRCVMDTSDPDIIFNSEGHCNHCIEYMERTMKRIYHGEQARKEIRQITNRIKKKGKNKKYDCIIGVSGGLDSCYAVYAARQLGLRPLAVHMDNGWDSEIAVQNIRNVCKK